VACSGNFTVERALAPLGVALHSNDVSLCTSVLGTLSAAGGCRCGCGLCSAVSIRVDSITAADAGERNHLESQRQRVLPAAAPIARGTVAGAAQASAETEGGGASGDLIALEQGPPLRIVSVLDCAPGAPVVAAVTARPVTLAIACH